MRKTLFLMSAMLGCAVTPAQTAMGGGALKNGPLPSTMIYVCKPRDGGGTCTTVQHAHLGAPNSCDGPRAGVV